MTRPLRLQVAGGTYHVTARGNARQPIFLDDADRRRFLRVVAKTRSRFDWRCLGYCVMGNHYHLLVETPQPNLARGMQQLNSSYAQAFNRRHRRAQSHVFQGRYHSVLLQRDSHLLEVVRYLAWNPVKDGFCDRPEAWPWSSHRSVLGLESSGLVAVDALLSYFGGVAAYRSFVDRIEPGTKGTDNGAVAGTEDFMRSMLPPSRPTPEVARAPWIDVRPSLSELLVEHERDEAMARAHREFGYTMPQIAAAAGCHCSTVSRRVHAWEATQMRECKI